MKKTLLFVFILFVTNIYSQERTISGIVSDTFGPVADISVTVKGTNKGTATDFDGKYSISAKQGDILVFSHITYKTVEKKVGNSNRINIFLKENNQVLDEVVITAMGVKNERKSLGYAVTKQKASTKMLIKNKINNSLIKPRNLQNIKIRGIANSSQNSDPLYILNGTLVSKERVTKINAKKIKSINIIKNGQASALYGVKGANGIVLIETNKVKKDEQKRIKQLQQQSIIR